jgi:CBS domain-containing protein
VAAFTDNLKEEDGPMQASDIMISQVYKVKENDKVKAVIEKFSDHRISGLPIVNERNEVIGYISDGDIMRYIGKKHMAMDIFNFAQIYEHEKEYFEQKSKTILNLNVMAIAKKKVLKVQWDTPIEEIAGILGEKKIKKVPVERKGVLVGIISRGDVIRHVFKQFL